MSWAAIFSVPCPPPSEALSVSISAALKCLLHYTEGLEDARIDVAFSGGCVLLTGSVPSEQAADIAARVAGQFTMRRVICDFKLSMPGAGTVQPAPC